MNPELKEFEEHSVKATCGHFVDLLIPISLEIEAVGLVLGQAAESACAECQEREWS